MLQVESKIVKLYLYGSEVRQITQSICQTHVTFIGSEQVNSHNSLNTNNTIEQNLVILTSS